MSPLRLFLRIAFRNREVYLLKVVTLAAAFASATLVILFSFSEFGYDRFHRDASNVFRLIKKNKAEDLQGNRLSTKIPAALLDTLVSLQGDSLKISRLSILNGLTVAAGRNLYSEKVHAADPSITDIFSFHILYGSSEGFHRDEPTAMISLTVAKQLFGSGDVDGQIISVYSLDDSVQLRVSAVYADFPHNSHEAFHAFILFDPLMIESFGFSSAYTGLYGRGARETLSSLESRLRTDDLEFIFQPLPEIYFGPRVLGEDASHGDFYSIWILLALTGLILFLALTTYVNLTSLTLPNRSRELAVRKLAGTSQAGLLIIFFKESLITVTVSFIAGAIILFLTADIIRHILSIDLLSLLLAGDLTLVVVVPGILLALTLSPLLLTYRFIRASPVRLLSADTITFPRFKRTLSVLQLGISIFLIVASLVIKRQINYSLLKEPGRNYDQVVYLRYPADLTREELARMRSGWRTYHPNIVDVIPLSQLPDRINSKEVNSNFFFLTVDPFYPEFFQLNMVTGNWFKPNSADSLVVLNERGRAEMPGTSANVIGVIEDISNQFNQPEKPTKFKIVHNPAYNYLCVRVLEVDIRRTINYLSDYFGDASIHVMNKRFEAWLLYQDRLNSMSNLLGIISALLSCCAIYGLSVSIVRDKLKQIAVHKICGASSQNIALLLARELLKETLVAIAIFGPATYIFISEFLRNFVYSTPWHWQDPLLPILYCAVVVMLLCGFQALTLNRNDLAAALKK